MNAIAAATPVRTQLAWIVRFRYRCLKARAVMLLVAGKRLRALAVFDAMLEIRAVDAYALASKAQVLVQLGSRDLAIEVQQQLAAAHPSLASGWFNLGYMLQHAGRDEAAASAFRAALHLQPMLDRAWYGLALSLISLNRLGEPDGAVAALKRNTALQPMSPFGWYQLARVQAQLGNLQEAEAIADRLQQFEPCVAAQLKRDLRSAARQGAWN